MSLAERSVQAHYFVRYALIWKFRVVASTVPHSVSCSADTM
jgi:hypothetical protein